MTVQPKTINRAAPYLWLAAGLMFCLSAWLGQQIAFLGVGVMFMLLGLSVWLKNRKADRL